MSKIILEEDSNTIEYVNNNRIDFYDTKELEELIKIQYPNDGFNTASLDKNLRKYAPHTIISKKGSNKFYLKTFIDKIDFSLMSELQVTMPKQSIKVMMDLSLYNGFTVNTAANILGMSRGSLIRAIESKKGIGYIDSDKEYVSRYDVEKWSEFKKTHTPVQEMLNGIEEEFISKFNFKKRFLTENFKKLLENKLFDNFKYTYQDETCFPIGYLFVNNKDSGNFYLQAKILLEEIIINAFGNRIEKLGYKLGLITNKNVRETLYEFSSFANNRFSKYRSLSVSPYIDILNELGRLNKEIARCSDDELISILSRLETDTAKEEFCIFVTHLKKDRKTSYSGKYNFERNYNLTPDDNKNPYTMEQYMRFGYLVLSDGHKWHDSFIEKATDKRAYSSAWLYAVLHYICGWRGIDMRENLPRPSIQYEPKEFIRLVRNKELSDKDARDISEQIDMKIKMLTIRPEKTKDYVTPDLVMEIPESIKVLLGTLIGLAEAHFQLSRSTNKKGLISREASNISIQRNFFGEEFINIFGEDSFSNIRANKNFETITAKNGEDQKLGSGYILASIARSHKFLAGEYAKSTGVYLEYYHKLDSSEVLIRELFERGVCSFVPYLLSKAIKGTDAVIQLDNDKQRELIQEIVPMNNYDTELTVQLFDNVIQRSQTKVNEIIKECSSSVKNPKETILNMLKKISHNNANGKHDNINCISIALGKGCICPLRETCIGCGEEIYLKSSLNELGNRVNDAKTKAYSSKTKGSQMKNILMVKNVLVPIVEEVLISLKSVYGIEEIEAYKTLLK